MNLILSAFANVCFLLFAYISATLFIFLINYVYFCRNHKIRIYTLYAEKNINPRLYIRS